MPNRNKNMDKCYCTLSNSSELEKIRNFIIGCASNFGFDTRESYNIALAVDEACSNLIKYAFKMDSSKEIQVRIEPSKDKMFVVSISDDAVPFDPLQISSPDMTEYFKKYIKGGLGIHIMKLFMDEISYKPKSDSKSKNVLMLKKQLK